MGNIVGGDLNHPSRYPEFEKWISDEDLWALANPDLKTFASGNSLDEFQFASGD